jgi:serine/threonine protein kinase
MLEAGTRLGPYEIQAPIGAGGMGEVYRARDTRLDRTVAIKILPPQFAGDPSLRERFDREARLISSLNHPHICALFDVGEQNGVAFLVVEHLEGETLASRLEKGRLRIDQALQIAVQLAGALDAAHRAAVVHRDVKPGNVMLTKAGAKLLDFGLARTEPLLSPPSGSSMMPTAPAAVTAQGTILGTLQYMSPEQLDGSEADARTDIFAFGAVVYEMVTGRTAFEGKSQASLISAITAADPAPMSTLQPVAPAALDRVIRKCLEKDPHDRWQSAKDLADELTWIARTDTASEARAAIEPTPTPVRARRVGETVAWIVAAVLGVALIATIVAVRTQLFTNQSATLVPYRASINLPQGVSMEVSLQDAEWRYRPTAVLSSSLARPPIVSACCGCADSTRRACSPLPGPTVRTTRSGHPIPGSSASSLKESSRRSTRAAGRSWRWRPRPLPPEEAGIAMR